MATFNLVRNSRVFYTTNVSATTGVVAASGFTTGNTQEIQVLDGFTFGQNSNADTVTISEAGGTPVRGQRSFNTSLGQADFSFSTYIRPYKATTVKAEEYHLWNSLLGSVAIGDANATAIDFTVAGSVGSSLTPLSVSYSAPTITFSTDMTVAGPASTPASLTVGEVLMVTGHVTADHNTAIKITGVTAGTSGGFTATWISAPASVSTTAADWTDVKLTRTAWNANSSYAEVTSSLSNKNQLVKFGMIMLVDGITYVIDNCCLNQAVIDFGLDGIAMVAWTGMGTILRQLAYQLIPAITSPYGITRSDTSASVGNYTYKNTTADFITNKLSTISLKAGIDGTGTVYNLALTGGSITINNNVTYVTPANLGVVNLPIGYFTGTRAISGSVTAYLRTGTTNTAGLLSTLLSAAATSAGIEPQYQLIVAVGGSTATTRVELELPMAFLQIPQINSAAVMSTTINFTAEGHSYDASSIDIENTNELEVRYYHG